MNTLLIYSPEISPRLHYICDWIFKQTGGLNYTITSSREEFASATSVLKVNYAKELINADIHWVPYGLLNENGIKSFTPEHVVQQQTPYLFPVQGGDLHFDLLSAAFYCISRYEEYTCAERDQFDRFPHIASWAFKHQVLNRPLVDEWIKALFLSWKKQFPMLKLKQNTFQFIPTYDIDIAYSYSGKPFYKQLASWLRGEFSLWKNWKFNHAKDPYDAYDQLDAWHKQYGLSPVYFILLSDGGKFNKNLPPYETTMQTLLARLKQLYTLGLHPSYTDHPESTWQKELQLLGNTEHTRQHYIRFQLPTTYRHLEALGFTQEYSMGYGSINGFRASTSRAFFWYDLEQERVSNLRVHPFCFMECNARFEQGLNSMQAAEELKHYEELVRKVNGTLITIWHNFSLGSDPAWAEWKEVYGESLMRLNSVNYWMDRTTHKNGDDA